MARGRYDHVRKAWTAPHTGARRVRELINASGQPALENTYSRRPHKFPPPWVPWFVEHNKARFPYMFPSLFPDYMAHYVGQY